MCDHLTGLYENEKMILKWKNDTKHNETVYILMLISNFDGRYDLRTLKDAGKRI